MTLITEPFIGGWWQQTVEDHISMGEEKEFRILEQEEFDWIFKGIPFGATSPLPEDKKQPERNGINYLPDFVIDHSFGTCPNDLKKRLQPDHGGLETQRLLCDRVEFESYNLKERLNGIR